MRKLIALSLLLCFTAVVVGCKYDGKVDKEGVEVDIDTKK